ncbi:hypothetical protein V6N11_055207 [Hibiscus sabdariffa]|uniref:Uncharacterized protein n=2 Tax=Hibiscus sabdariffa TaxID=183260 RepID=A0ABR2PER0_9ROSI
MERIRRRRTLAGEEKEERYRNSKKRLAESDNQISPASVKVAVENFQCSARFERAHHGSSLLDNPYIPYQYQELRGATSPPPLLFPDHPSLPSPSPRPVRSDEIRSLDRSEVIELSTSWN